MKPIKTLTSNQKADSVLLILLGLFSFGGGTGRIIFGLGIFDFILIIMFSFSILRTNSNFKIKTYDFQFFTILFLILMLGVIRAKLATTNIAYDFFITELRFYIYIPFLYFITLNYKLHIDIIEKVLPYIILFYILIWSFFLGSGTFIFNFFNNNDFSSTIGTQERINGPPILILVPLLLLLINQKTIKPWIIGLYTSLTLIVFIKTGGRTYFIYYLIPIFYILYMKRKNAKLFFVSILLILTSFFILRELTSSAFFERFLNITRVTEDTSFMYRVLNIQEMLDRLKGNKLWLGYGIGSNYEVNLYGWKKSFFLDNTFITLIYKVGIIGLWGFILMFLLSKNKIPKNLFVFELSSLILIGIISYHLILNPVFIFGYFLILNYFRHKNGSKNY